MLSDSSGPWETGIGQEEQTPIIQSIPFTPTCKITLDETGAKTVSAKLPRSCAECDPKLRRGVKAVMTAGAAPVSIEGKATCKPAAGLDPTPARCTSTP